MHDKQSPRRFVICLKNTRISVKALLFHLRGNEWNPHIDIYTSVVSLYIYNKLNINSLSIKPQNFSLFFASIGYPPPLTNPPNMPVDTLSLAGKTAIITGSGRENGIGAAIATAFARNGASVAIHYVSEGSKGKAEKVAAGLTKDFGVKTTVVQGSVDNYSTAKRLVEETLKAFGVDHIDILGMYLSYRGIVPWPRLKGTNFPPHSSQQWNSYQPRSSPYGGHTKGSRKGVQRQRLRYNLHDTGRCRSRRNAHRWPHHQHRVYRLEAKFSSSYLFSSKGCAR